MVSDAEPLRKRRLLWLLEFLETLTKLLRGKLIKLAAFALVLELLLFKADELEEDEDVEEADEEEKIVDSEELTAPLPALFLEIFVLLVVADVAADAGRSRRWPIFIIVLCSW